MGGGAGGGAGGGMGGGAGGGVGGGAGGGAGGGVGGGGGDDGGMGGGAGGGAGGGIGGGAGGGIGGGAGGGGGDDGGMGGGTGGGGAGGGVGGGTGGGMGGGTGGGVADDAGIDAGEDAGIDAGDDAGTDAGVDDAGVDDAGVDAGSDAGVDGGVMMASGEDCANAITLASGDVAMSSTADAGNDFVFIDSNGCQGSSTLANGTAGDRVFKVSVPAGQRVYATLDTPSFDSTLNMMVGLMSCGMATDAGTVGVLCARGHDDPEPQTASYLNTTMAAQEAYFLVDGYSSGSGDFSLRVNIDTPSQGDRCENPIPLTAGTALTNQNIGTAVDDYAGSGTGCAFSSNNGDLVYSITIPAGQGLSLTVTPTAASATLNTNISLVTDVAACNSRSCLANSSTGGAGVADTMTWNNRSSSAQSVLIIVDASTNTGGSFDILASIVAPQPGDYCSAAVAADTGTVIDGGYFFGAQTLFGYSSDYAGGTLCAGGSFSGVDRVYSAVIPAGLRGNVIVAPDGGLNVSISAIAPPADNCEAASRVCVGGVDRTSSTGAAGIERLSRYNGSMTPEQLYVIVDSSSTSGGLFDISFVADLPPTGDVCEVAGPAITSATTLTAQTTTGFYSEYNGNVFGCTGTLGLDRAYEVVVPGGQQLTATVQPDAGFNPTLDLVEGPASNCNARVCVAGANLSSTGGVAETARWANGSMTSRSVFVIVDGTSTTGSGSGNFNLDIAFANATAGETCYNPIGVTTTPNPDGGVGDVATFTGVSMAGFSREVQVLPASTTCATYTGNDAVYSVTIPAGGTLDVSVTSAQDSVINLLDAPASNCGPSPACLANADATGSGSAESVTFTNTTMAARTVFVVVSQYSQSTTTMTYSMTVTLR